uniref:Putative conserved secreted protein n=1 Tax=Ixodes ricinus TaxID=34613 RepID=A0A6B0UVK1_IXORI
MNTKLPFLTTFILVLHESFGILGSSVQRKSGAGPHKCGTISGFVVSTVSTPSSTVTVTYSNWTYGTVTRKFEYIGNYTGHEMCLSNCNPRRPRPCTCRRGCVCLPMNDYPDVGRCVKEGTPLPNGVDEGKLQFKNKKGKKTKLKTKKNRDSE